MTVLDHFAVEGGRAAGAGSGRRPVALGMLTMTVLGQPALATDAATTPRHSVYDTFEQTSHLREDWNNLATRAGDLFASYDWCEVWWRHFGRGRLEIHTLHDGPRLVGVLPLFREVILLGFVCLHVVRLLACDYTVDTAGLAVEADYAGSFAHAVLGSLWQRGPWDVLHLGPLRSYATVTEQMGCAATRHPHVQAVAIGRRDSWQTLFDLPVTYEAYLQALPRRERQETLRRERKLHECHAVQLVEARSPDDVRQGVDALIRWHQCLWNGKGQRGQFADSPAIARFHHEIAQRLLCNGQLALLTLQVDGEVLGAAYGSHFGGRTHTMFRGYCNDPAWRPFGLGRLLHCNMVRQAIGHGSTVLESGRGVFDYKLRLGGQLHGERSLTLIRRGRTTRLRVWLALRIVYLVHVLYGRIWLDRVAPRLHLRTRPRPFYVRSRFLAQLFRRIHLPLWGGPPLQETRCVEPIPPAVPGTCE